MKRNFRDFGIVGLLFLLSLLPRLKNIQTGEYPSVIPHLQVLQTLRVWQHDGPADHAYLPVQTWSNPNDKFITYFERLQNHRGDNYYVSYPPFAFELAYGFCRLTGSYSVLSLTVLNLLLQWLGAWYIYLLVRVLLPRREGEKRFWPGMAAAAVFLCNPAAMRLYSQLYFSEAVGTTLLCAFLYYAARLTRNPRSGRALAGMAVSLFLLVYTEWVGFFAAAVFGLFWFVKAFRHKVFFVPVLLAVLATLAAAGLFAYQLHVITGGGDFLANLQERYLARTGLRDKEQSVGDTVFKQGFWPWLANNFRVTLYGARWFVPVLLLGTWGYIRRQKTASTVDRAAKALFGCVLLVVCLNFTALFNFSMMHSYTWAKWGIPLGLVAAWCVYRLGRSRAQMAALAFTALFFVTDLVFYYGFGSKDTAPVYWEQLTAFIKKEAGADETLFLTTVSEEIDPSFHLTYYTGRNLANVKNADEAKTRALALGRKKIVWFNFNQFEGRMEAHHIQLP